jgi:hypothetical protein
MQLFRINTTAFSEEDLLLLTDLTKDQIVETAQPFIYLERQSGDNYVNEDVVSHLKNTYPDNKIIALDEEKIEQIIL